MFLGDDLSVLIKLLKLAVLVNNLAKRRKATDSVSGLVLLSYILS